MGRNFEARLLVSSNICGRIIGRGGSNIKRLRQTFDAVVKVSGFNGPERVLTVTAHLNVASQVLLQLLPLTINGSQGVGSEVEARLLVHQSQAGLVIERSGAMIKSSAREESRTCLKVFPQCCPRSSDRVVNISGGVKAVVEAVKRVVASVSKGGAKGSVQPYDSDDYSHDAAGEYGGFGGDGAGKMNHSRSVGVSAEDDGGLDSSVGRGGAGLLGDPPSEVPSRDSSANSTKPGRSEVGVPKSRATNDSNSSDARAQKMTDQVHIPREFAGPIIGPAGAHLNIVRAQTGARIFVGKPGKEGAPDSECVLTISGSEEQVMNAHYRLQMMVLENYGKYCVVFPLTGWAEIRPKSYSTFITRFY